MSTVTHYLFTCNKDYNGGRKTKNNVGLPKKKKKKKGKGERNLEEWMSHCHHMSHVT